MGFVNQVCELQLGFFSNQVKLMSFHTSLESTCKEDDFLIWQYILCMYWEIMRKRGICEPTATAETEDYKRSTKIFAPA